LDPAAEAAMIEEIEQAKRERDTLGGVTEVRAFGVPPGLGSHVSAGARLDGRLAAAMLSIQSAKGVEIGDALVSSTRRGSRVHDEIFHSDADGYHRRTDAAVLPAAAVVAEAAVAWELARAAVEKFGGDAVGDFVAAHAAYLERISR